MEQKRGIERPKEKILDNLLLWHGSTFVSGIIGNTQDRKL